MGLCVIRSHRYIYNSDYTRWWAESNPEWPSCHCCCVRFPFPLQRGNQTILRNVLHCNRCRCFSIRLSLRYNFWTKHHFILCMRKEHIIYIACYNNLLIGCHTYYIGCEKNKRVPKVFVCLLADYWPHRARTYASYYNSGKTRIMVWWNMEVKEHTMTSFFASL